MLESLNGDVEFTTPSAWPSGSMVSSQMLPPCCQMKPLICMLEKS